MCSTVIGRCLVGRCSIVFACVHIVCVDFKPWNEERVRRVLDNQVMWGGVDILVVAVEVEAEENEGGDCHSIALSPTEGLLRVRIMMKS